jgi:hypothetical protein
MFSLIKLIQILIKILKLINSSISDQLTLKF